LIAKHRRTLTEAKWEEGKKVYDPFYCTWLYRMTSQGGSGFGAPTLQNEQGGWPDLEWAKKISPSPP
jgi:hypothetical protein